MTRTSFLAGVAGLAGLAAGCGDTTTTPITELNLERPVDVAFACYGEMRLTMGAASTADQQIIQSAMPTYACDQLSPPLTPDTVNNLPAIVPATGQESINGVQPKPAWYAFILQSASGTVAVATWLAQPADKMLGGVSDNGGDFQVLDADPLTPGKNAISIGEDPIAIITDKLGCYEVTANAGSCDLSELSINSALDDVIGAGDAMTATQVVVNRVPIHTPTKGPILARPAAMIAESSSTTVGNVCTASASGRVWIAYPTCHMVAGVDTSDGSIFSAITFDPVSNAPSVVTDPAALDALTCPVECSGTTATAGSLTAGMRPVALNFKQDLRTGVNTLRLAIGADNSNLITMVDLDPSTFAPVADPAKLFQIPLEKPTPTSKLGVTALALSPQIGMGGNFAVTNKDVTDDEDPAGQGQYVYAVASDATVRVADVLNVKRECDTQVDDRFVRTSNISLTELQCIGPADNLPRRTGARGPGIELPGDAVPTSVAIVKARTSPPPIDPTNAMSGPAPAGPSVWLGYFAAISSTTGAVFVANVDDDYAPDSFALGDPLNTAPVLVMPHQLRDSFSTRGAGPQVNSTMTTTDPTTGATTTTTMAVPACLTAAPLGGSLAGGPRVTVAPAQAPPTNTLSTDFNGELPNFLQVKCQTDASGDAPAAVALSELQFGANLTTVRDFVYPDLKSVVSETWTAIYEGTLSLDNQVTSIDGPVIRQGKLAIDGLGMHLQDPAAPFCNAGVEPFDIVDLRGCDPSNIDADCPANYTCYVHPKSNVGVGACLLKTEAPRLADACFDFLTTLRRYTVSRASTGELVLLERKHELAMTPVDGCTSDDECNQLAQVSANLNPSADRFLGAPTASHTGTTWSCQADPMRAPISADDSLNKRCVQTCSSDPTHRADCGIGSVCRPNPGSMTEGVCMEGVEPPQSCVNGPQRYDMRASEAFTLVGSTSGYIHPFIAGPDGSCIADPKASLVQRGRIPVHPVGIPACATTPSPGTQATGQITPGVFEANPCIEPVQQFDFQPGAPIGCGQTPPTAAVVNVNPLAFRSATAIKLRNPAMQLTLVDPYKTCVLPVTDQPPVNVNVNVSFAPTGYQLEFEQKSGFEPYQLGLFGAVTPVKMVSGPSGSLWVVDDGDFIATSITDASTRGRVFRIEGINPTVINTME